jgi:GNAT superfamily N-acetyltransferase
MNIRAAVTDEHQEIAALIHASTNEWYARRGLGPIFPGSPDDCRLFPDVYEELDPGCCLVAADAAGGGLLGSCFYHPRATHVALGIMNVRSDQAGQGVARALLERIGAVADAAGLPLRLVSSCFNLDSFSLYTRQGFVPYVLYQDMTISVPGEGLGSVPFVSGMGLRPGRPDDAPAIAALERSVWETSRPGDWQHFLDNRRGIWHVNVAEASDGTLVGAMASVCHPASTMLGPGVALDAVVAGDLIQAELDHHRGRSPVFLIPCAEGPLVARMYALGARNCELHVGQCRGKPPQIRGIVMPTFMPETA